jgi:hypothetical protein
MRNEELHNFYSSPNIVRQIRENEVGVASMGEKRKVNMVLVGKPEGKRPLGRPRHRWEDGIRMELKEIGWGVCVE